ncbi:MAG TPA: CaiB/BaiF CoA-transferase family protein [Geminicoccus sp.]|jgi:crotonobetainyl-CoA:carnitine CoA-transferase CaiB-like acyl-CoA transferase|uniref:CaiB/BaiF CoA transferase family protein n=1 Tax=Geminicoccus sp. TaxID=2024832 RepID=UPI002E308209|nr:CaiB/BaiF CoA-transferase family protein [Geminicoccus sp.]HEX2525365.1 CaiB/BaiF CoA-transferase family protein [Geminicoccus sp.]
MSTALPLEGVRVLDLSRILAGPTCTQLLGDLGAEVIKVEKPGEGDDTRKWGPPYVKDGAGQDTAESAYYLSANRNKRSVAIDIATEQGAELVRRLLADCHVLVENFKVGGLTRYGLGYPQLRERFPALVYCSITGFGQTGPYRERAGYDYLAQGYGGIMSLTGEPDGQPMKVGVGIADVMCGMYACVGVLAALRHAERTGEGQQIDLALLDSQVAWLINEGTNYLLSGKPPRRLGNQHPNIVPYRVFQAADGHVILAVGNDAQFRRFCSFAGLDALPDDPRYATNLARVHHRDDLDALLPPVMAMRTIREWVDGLNALGVPCGAVNTLPDVFASPQVRARGMKVDVPHESAGSGTVPLLANPLRLSETPVQYRQGPPTLGQHTDLVLRERLGLEEDELERLRDHKVIG